MADTPTFDEVKVREKLTATGKYNPQQIDLYINTRKSNPQLFTKTETKGTDLSAANFGQPVVTEQPQSSIIGDFGKSFYNGMVPELLKGVSDLPKLVLDATDNNSPQYDHINKVINEGIDKYLTFDIPEQNAQAPLDNPRSFLNAIGAMLGTIAGTAGMALIGDEPGAALGVASIGQKLKSLAAFTTYMINPIMESGKRAGLSDVDNARMTLILAPAVASTSMLSELWGPGLANRLAGKELAAGVTEGIETELKALATEGVTKEMFRDVAKKTSSKIVQNMQRLSQSPVLKEAAKAAGAGYLMGAVEQGGQQLYDNFFADPNAKVGEGKFGTSLFSAESIKTDMTNALLGGLLGGAMGAFHASPIVDESVYGYLDNAVRTGKADKAVETLSRVTDDLVNKQILPKEAADAVKGKIEKIRATAESFNKLKEYGTPIDAETRYEAYNLEHNVKADIIEKGIKPYEATKAEYERMKTELEVQEQGGALSPDVNPAIVGKMEQILKTSEPEYLSAKDKVVAINDYLTELGKTGQRGDIRATLAEIDAKYAPKEEIRAEEQATQDIKGEEQTLTDEGVDTAEQQRILTDEIQGLKDNVGQMEAENADFFEPEIAEQKAKIVEKEQELLNLANKTKENEGQQRNIRQQQEESNERPIQGERGLQRQTEEIIEPDGQRDAGGQRNLGTEPTDQERGDATGERLSLYEKAPQAEVDSYLTNRVKELVNGDFEGLVDTLIEKGIIKKVKCK